MIRVYVQKLREISSLDEKLIINWRELKCRTRRLASLTSISHVWLIGIDRECLSSCLHLVDRLHRRHLWGMIRHDSRFMKMSPTYCETTTMTTTTRMAAAACEAFTNISTLVRARTCACVRAHRRYTHYLMASTYVFAVNRSLKEHTYT